MPMLTGVSYGRSSKFFPSMFACASLTISQIIDQEHTIISKDLLSIQGQRVLGSADLRAKLHPILEADNASLRRVIYLTNQLVVIACEKAEIHLHYPSAIDIMHILDRAREYGAAGFVIVDHYPRDVDLPNDHLETETVVYRALAKDANVEMLDHVIVSADKWFSQSFRRHIDLLVKPS